MYKDQRRGLILDLIKENGSCRVQNLSEMFSVSEPTIRHDLEALEKDGLIIRQHGGAYLKGDSSISNILQLAPRGHSDEKKRIAHKATSYVEPGDTIILDSGSTVTALAECIVQLGVTVITNAINIAMLMSGNPNNNIILIGGELKLPTLSLTGSLGLSMFKSLHAKKLFLATGSFNIPVGLAFPSFADIEIKKTMIESADEVYLLADSSKIGKTQLATLGMLDQIDYLITDSGISKENVRKIEDLGIQVILA